MISKSKELKVRFIDLGEKINFANSEFFICPRIFENFWGIRRVVRFFFLFFGKKITEAGNFTFDKIFLLRPVTTLPVTFLYLIDTRTSLLIIILIPSSNWQNYEF